MENKGLWAGVLAAFILSLVALVLAVRPVGPAVEEQRYGGTTGLDSLYLKNDLTVDDDVTVTGDVAVSGAVSFTGTIATASSTLLRVGAQDSNDSVDFIGYATSSIDADSIGNGSVTTSAVTVTGASIGDIVSLGLTGSWAGASSSVDVRGSVTAANTVTLYFQNTSSTAVNLSASTYAVEVTSHP